MRVVDFLDILKGTNRARIINNASSDVDLNLPLSSGDLARIQDLPNTLTAFAPGDKLTFWDCEAAPTSTTPDFLLTTSAGSLTSISPDETKRVGVIQLSTGTSATSRYHIGSVANNFCAGSGTIVYSIDIKIPNLSTVTDRFQTLLGLINVSNSINQTNGIYFLYDEGGATTGSTASVNWQLVTVNNSVRTFSNSSIAVSTGWTNLRIEVNATGTSVSYYVNNVLAGTVTTNIPVGTARLTGWGFSIYKSIGTTARFLQIDWVYVRRSFSTLRSIPDLNLGKRIIISPSSQPLTATTTIVPSNPIIDVASIANITLTNNPNISTGIDGQEITIYNSGSFNINFTEGNGVVLNGTLSLIPQTFATFQFIGNNWRLKHTNGKPVWSGFAYTNSFTDAGSGQQIGQYTKWQNEVILRGIITRPIAGITSGLVIANLPSGFRPLSIIGTSIHSAGNVNCDPFIDVQVNGDMIFYFYNTFSFAWSGRLNLRYWN